MEFDRQCSTERKHDPLTIMDGAGKIICTRSGREWSDWSTEVRIAGTSSCWPLRIVIFSVKFLFPSWPKF